MEKITDLTHFTSKKKTIVTIGTFDGVHVGHQKIIKKISEEAKKADVLSTIFTLFPHPRMVLQQDDSLHLIQTLDEKVRFLETCGIDQLIVYPFSVEFSRMTAEDFVYEILVKKLRVKKVIIGYNHRFGRNRKANIGDMRAFGEKYDFEVEEISAQEIDEVSVSSTKVRNALNDGDIETANSFLGRPFELSGKVVHGLKIGRTLGYPTANIQVKESYKLIPKDGIYVVYGMIDNQKHYGMMSIGKNPTIEGKGRTIEVYFFDFQKDIYNKNIELHFLKRLRDEQKFSSLEALKTQLSQDQRSAEDFIKNLL